MRIQIVEGQNLRLRQGYSQTKIALSLRGNMITVYLTHRYLLRDCRLLKVEKFAVKEEVRVLKMQ